MVIPTYNRADFIEATVESVLGQTFSPLEVIIVDDGSTDSTPEICAAFSNPVRYIRRENRGVSAARNAGILAAQGDWIAFCDSDDLWCPHKLELQMSALLTTGAGWSITDFGIIGPDGRTVGEKSGISETFVIFSEGGMAPASHFAKWLEMRKIAWGSATTEVFYGDAFGMLFLGNVALTSTSVVDRDLIRRAGLFNETLRVAEDTEFFHRISTFSKAVILMKPLTEYRVGHAALTKGDPIPYIENTLQSIEDAAQRRLPLTTKERAAFHEGRRQFRMRLAYARLSSLDRAGARQALYDGLHEGGMLSPRSTAIMLASLLPDTALRSLHWAKRAIAGRHQ